MNKLINLHHALAARLEASAPYLLPSLARFTFVATLFVYYIHSAKLKVGDGVMGWLFPADGAYYQIFPKAIEAAGYDVSNLGIFHYLVALAGTWAEFILPVLILAGLFTRLAALGMISFIFVQTLTDLYGHGGITHAETLGAWFDRFSGSLILDQRLFWVTILVVLVVKGAGPLSLDRILAGKTDTA